MCSRRRPRGQGRPRGPHLCKFYWSGKSHFCLVIHYFLSLIIIIQQNSTIHWLRYGTVKSKLFVCLFVCCFFFNLALTNKNSA